MNYFEYNDKQRDPKQTDDKPVERKESRSEYDANRDLLDTIRFIAAVRLK